MSNSHKDQEKIEAYARALAEAGHGEGRANEDLVQWQHAKKFSPEVLQTLAVMSEEDDTALIEAVAQRYKDILDSEDKTVSVTVTTVVPLDESLRAAILKKTQAELDAPVYLIERVDPSIIGGILVEVRGKRYDATVKAQLANIRNTLSSSFMGGDD